jgi:asparagine synthase (glutamine-hydrolysing)
LKAKGHKFKSNCDTEVVLHSYEEWGEECLKRFNGMFAFAIWDGREKKVFVARDRLGIKPLYYMRNEDGIIFSSEIKTMLSYLKKKEIDMQALYSYLLLLWVPGEKTIFKNIFKLEAGSYFVYKKEKLIIKKYWDIPFKKRRIEKKELFHLLEDSVKLRLVSDVGVGVFLSGGIDSSLIVGLIQKLQGGGINSYTIAYEEEATKLEAMPCDTYYAEKVAQMFSTHHKVFTIKPNLIKLLPKLVWHLDEPIGDPAIINTYLICKNAKKEGITVLLSGMGGDELFGGYRKYLSVKLGRYFSFFPKEIKRKVIEKLKDIPVRSEKKGYRRIRWGKWFFRKIGENWKESFLNNSTYYTEEEMKKLLPIKGVEDYYKEKVWNLFDKTEGIGYINQMCYVDTKLYLRDLNLTYTDKASMGASSEVRVPFLDHRIVEFAFSLEGRTKINNLTTKYFLKQIASSLLSKEIIHRPKAPFGAPLRRWIWKELNPLIKEVLSKENIKKRNLLSAEYVEEIIEKNRKGIEDYAHRIWGLLVLEIWHQTFMNNEKCVVRL